MATACLWVMTPRNAPVLLYAGGQRKQLIQDGRDRL